VHRRLLFWATLVPKISNGKVLREDESSVAVAWGLERGRIWNPFPGTLQTGQDPLGPADFIREAGARRP
jgi:hypothetical protein